MISCCVILDVSNDLATDVARLLAAHRRALSTRRRIEALTPWAQGMSHLGAFLQDLFLAIELVGKALPKSRFA